jgi:hypothetical protein
VLAAAIATFGALGYLLVAQPVFGLSLMWLALGTAQWTALRWIDSSVDRFGVGTTIGALGGIAVSLPVASALPASGHYVPLVALVGVAAGAVGLGQGIALADGLKRRNSAIALHVAASAIGAMLGATTGLLVGDYVFGADFTSVPRGILTVAGGAATGAGVYGMITGSAVAIIVALRSRSRRPGPSSDPSVAGSSR